MTDPDVKRELEENEARAADNLKDAKGGLEGTMDSVLKPITDALKRTDSDEPDLTDRSKWRQANDAEQRPD